MKNNSTIADDYFYSNSAPAQNLFLDYACECMLTAFMKKTMFETRKGYAIRKSREQQYFLYTDDKNLTSDSSTDTYDYYFYELIEDLSAKQQRVIILCYKFGYDDTFAAKKLGISKQAVGSMKKRALESLRKKLTLKTKGDAV